MFIEVVDMEILMKKNINLNGQIRSILYWPIVYIFLLIWITVASFEQNLSLGYMCLVILGFSVIIYIVAMIYVNKKMKKDIVSFSIQYGHAQNRFLSELETPIIVINDKGQILWHNQAIKWISECEKVMNRPIGELISGFDLEMLPQDDDPVERVIHIEQRTFKVIIVKHRPENTAVEYRLMDLQVGHVAYSMFFLDVTQEKVLELQNEDQKIVTGLLYLDNYEEVLNSMEDVRRPLLIGLIDRNINKFGKSNDAIVKKFEKDKYLILFQHKYLKQLKDSKFTILDDIREINMGNELPVTASIGLGLNDESYLTALDAARLAIDLALGRGGDQAVIKKNDKFFFYGGKSKGIEKSTRVKARVKAYAFRELIEECSNLIIMGHKYQDLDSLGAALGVYSCAKQLEKEAHIVINDVTSATRLLYDRIMESGQYPVDLFINSMQVEHYIDENTLVVVVDVNRPSYMEYPSILGMAKNVVVFDHHRVSAEHIENTVLSYIEPYASSTCEMVTEILRYISDKVKLEPIEADALFAGISVDTKNFVVKTGVKTFEAAAFLRRNGADVIRVRKLFKNDMESYKAKATAVRDAIIYKEVIAISVCPSNVSNAALVAAQAADELLGISGIKASFVLSDINGTIFISARSFDDMNVQLVMEKLGGGGHLSVAGAQLTGLSMGKAVELLKNTIDTYIEEGEKE